MNADIIPDNLFSKKMKKLVRLKVPNSPNVSALFDHTGKDTFTTETGVMHSFDESLFAKLAVN